MLPIDKLAIITEGHQVVPYLTQIEEFANSERVALGFLPRSVFSEKAGLNRLWIAVAPSTGECLGYLMFGGRFPRLSVVQLFVDPQHHGQGVGTRLITELAAYGERNDYLRIYARVAADLPANGFWERVHFSILRQVLGGSSARRNINVRCRELNTPSLLKMMSCQMTGPTKELQYLKMRGRPLLATRTYIFDLNVFFDIVRRRPHRPEAEKLIASGLNSEIRLLVSPEFVAELSRHSSIERSDPVLEFALQLPALPKLDRMQIDPLVSKLQPLVFPSVPSAQNSSPQTRSDLVHLAYCVHYRATAFITRDKAILASSRKLQEAYGLEVLSPAELMAARQAMELPQSHLRARVVRKEVSIAPVEESHRSQLEVFLSSLGATAQTLAVLLCPGSSTLPRRRVMARVGEQIMAVASWDSPDSLGQHRVLHLYVDESYSQAETVIDHFIEVVLRDMHPSTASLTTLDTGPEQLITQSTAEKRGFLRTQLDSPQTFGHALHKFAWCGVISAKNWSSLANAFQELTDLSLPSRMPSMREFIHSGIPIQDQHGECICNLDLFDFEVLVSPGILAFPGREALIVPIKKQFADDLLPITQEQPGLFPAPEALLRIEKAYFRKPINASAVARGALILFYVSGSGGGAKGVIGCARVTFSDVLSISEVGTMLERQGVLPFRVLEGIADNRGRVHVFTFDNFNRFPRNISYRELKTKGMISGTNLVTLQKLSAPKLVELMELAFGGGSSNV